MSLGVARTLFLDSSSATAASNGRYQWTYPQGLILGPPGCTVKCYILHAEFYNVIHNVPSGSTLKMTVDGTTTTASLAEGQYDTTSFASAVTAAFPLITVAYETSTGKFTLSSSYSFTVHVTGSTVLSQLGLSTSDDTTAVLSGATYSVTGPNIGSLGAPQYLQIASSLHSLNVANDDIESGSLVLARIPVNTYWGELTVYHNTMGSFSTILDSVIHKLEIRMTDSLGSLVDFQGTSWSLALFFEAIPDPTHLSLLDQYGLRSDKNVPQGQQSVTAQLDNT